MKAILSFMFLALMAMNIPTFGQDTSAVELYEALEIKGEITFEDETLEGAFVELYENNDVVDAFETKKNGKFKFTLYNEHIYTIQITKKGYYTKRISVSTKLPADYEDFQKFEFNVGLVSKDEADYDPYLSEYPSALISFDKKKKEFTYDKNYTKTYFDDVVREEE